PSMYHLMTHLDVNDGVLYPEGGFARVIESFAELATAAGASIVTGARVTKIIVDRGRARGVRVEHADGTTAVVAADLVVATADLHHVDTELLDPEHRDRSPAWWRRREP